ncbi:WD repeat-containing protein 11-like [Styela clava]
MEGRNPAIIPQRIIPGVLSPQNEKAFHWGWQGLIACGSQKTVLIIDPNTLQVVQTLVKHRYPVNKVKWATENYHHDVASPYSLRVASVDTSGRVVVWDVAQGNERAEFIENGKTLTDLEWLNCQDASHDLLVAIHSPNMLALWNADTGTKLWRKTYDNVPTLHSITIDPFEPTRFAALGSDCILFVNDFSISRQPTSDGKKFYMSVDKAQKNVTPTRVNLTAMGRAAISGIRLLIGDEKPKSNELTLTDCRQLSFLPSMRHHLAAVFPREILILDVSVLQAVASIPLERNGSPFMQVLPVRQRAALFCAHENGSFSFRLRRFMRLNEESLSEEDGSVTESLSSKVDLNFDTACHSEPFRVTNRIRPMAAALCPVTERQAAVLVSDGRIFIWKLSSSKKREKPTNSSSIYSPRFFSPAIPRNHTLSGIIAPTQNILPLNSEKDDLVWGDQISLKFTMVGLFSSLSSQVSCIKMCPPLTHKNWPHYRPLLAVGLVNGNILVFDLGTGKLTYEFGVHTCEVKGIEWSGLRSIISFAYPTQGNNSTVINEISTTNLQSGRTVPFRTDKVNESPINFIKISSKKQYLMIVFHDKPIELWDIRTLCILKELPKSFPTIHAVEWAPAHTVKKKQEDGQAGESEMIHTKEHLVLTDSAATLYHCIAEGSSFKQGSRIPHISERNSTTTCISWKHDHIFMGDTDGTVSIWNLKTKLSKGIPTHRGWVKKVRFGPGKGNLNSLVLFEDGLEIWDADDGIAVSAVKTPKQLPKIIDVDWCASDKLVLSCENGQILIMDSALTLPPPNLPTAELYYWKSLSCPYLLPTKPALIMKALLQHGKLSVESLGDDFGYKAVIQNAINALPANMKEFILKNKNTLARCTAVARIFGDESEIHLWETFSYYATNKNIEPDKPMVTDTNLDTLCDCEIFRLNELQRSYRHGLLRNSPGHTKKCIENLVLFGQVDKAINLSLETEPTSSSYYEDCLKSCLLASLKCNPESSQSSVKLVSTNLIANGRLQEGVELLCMINKSLDACRYLASHGQWELAVWLAKIRLTGTEYEEIMIRWANHLCSPRVNNKSKAILVYLSLRKFSRVLETFYQMRYFDRAAMFAQICHELNVIEDDEKLKPLIESIHSEYARFLQQLGCEGELVTIHSAQAGETDKNEMNEAASDDTNSSTSSGVMISSPSSNSDDYEKVG